MFLKRSILSIPRIIGVEPLDLRHFSNFFPRFLPSSLPSTSNVTAETGDAGTYSHCNEDQMAFSVSAGLLKCLSGILFGSSLGFWIFSSSFSFADYSTDMACTDVRLRAKRELGVDIRPPVSPSQDKAKYLFADEYRRRIFFNYEKRLRLQSPPEKIFEYFASVRTCEGELLMTPADFMRAVVPVFPPAESDMVRCGRLRGEPLHGHTHSLLSEFFMLFDTNNDGLISFPEYIFFLTLLSLPESSFSLAFKMFDLDNSGVIERDEFKQVMNLMRSCNRQGASHRDGFRIGLKVGSSVDNGGLVEHFFGKDGNETLELGKFVGFLGDLHKEVLRLEFTHYDYKLEGKISSTDFALSMVASADINCISKFLNRVDEIENDPHLREMHINFKEFTDFAELRKNLHQMALALFSYGQIKGSLTKSDFKRAASHVCGIDIADNVVDLVYHVFDLNHDGNLSYEEFLHVLEKRENGVTHPVWKNCAMSSLLVQLLR